MGKIYDKSGNEWEREHIEGLQDLVDSDIPDEEEEDDE